MKLNKNLVLIGMMGSGKSSIGKILSKKLEFEFIDTDNKIEEIEKKTGKTESEIIKIMRRSVKPTSFRLWRKRVNQKSIKHRKKFEYERKKIRNKNINDYI